MTEPFPAKDAADRAIAFAPAAADSEAEIGSPQRSAYRSTRLNPSNGVWVPSPSVFCCDASAEAYTERVHLGHTTSSLLYTI